VSNLAFVVLLNEVEILLGYAFVLGRQRLCLKLHVQIFDLLLHIAYHRNLLVIFLREDFHVSFELVDLVLEDALDFQLLDLLLLFLFPELAFQVSDLLLLNLVYLE
jgi:hypothetical protein